MSKPKTNEVTQHELITIAATMAEELQGVVNDSDTPLPGTKVLLEEWEAIYKRTDCYWQKSILTSDEEPDPDWWPM